MTVESTIDYEGLAQEAMRGVVRKVIANTAKSGLAGDHHFYISFDTDAPGVSLSKRLKEKYPREMTIVLQHRFWDLSVTDERFEVKLTFDGIPERLVVPFAAIKVFFDPSVRFGLQFEDTGADKTGGAFDPLSQQRTRTTHTRKTTRSTRKPAASDEAADRPVGAGAGEAVEPAPMETPPAANSAPPAPTPLSPKTAAAKRDDAAEETAGEGDGEAPPKTGGAEIVSLDKFRKK